MAQSNIAARDKEPAKQEPAACELVSILRKTKTTTGKRGRVPGVKKNQSVLKVAKLQSEGSKVANSTSTGNVLVVAIKKSQKPRRRVATIAQRRAANIRERRRMFNLNAAFDRLRKKVPSFAYEKRLSRIETLKLAIMYIRFMDDLVNDDAYAEKYKQLLANSSNGSSQHHLNINHSQHQNASGFSFPTQPNQSYPLYCPPASNQAPSSPPSAQNVAKSSSFSTNQTLISNKQAENNNCEDCCAGPLANQLQYHNQLISSSRSPLNAANSVNCCPTLLSSPQSFCTSSCSSANGSSSWCQSSGSPASSFTTTSDSSSSSSPIGRGPISLLFDNNQQLRHCIQSGEQDLQQQQQQAAQYQAYEQFQDNISITTYYNCDQPTKYYNELNFQQKACHLSGSKQYHPQQAAAGASSQISDLSQAHSNQFEQQQRNSFPLPLPAATTTTTTTNSLLVESSRLNSANGSQANYSLQSLEAR